MEPNGEGGRTFVLSYVLERECEAGVLSLDDAHLAKGALSDDSQQAEVVQVDFDVLSAAGSRGEDLYGWGAWLANGANHDGGLARTLVGEDDGLAVTLAHGGLQWQTACGVRMAD